MISTLFGMTSIQRRTPIRPATVAPAAQPLVITADDGLLDPVLAVCASADVRPVVVAEPGAVRQSWPTASVVIIGIDLAPSLSQLVLPRRDHVYLVGDQDRQLDLCAWSVPLHASVILVPDGTGWLSTALADVRGGTAHGLQVAVLGGHGGAGASTLAAGLAWTGAQRGRSTLLVDLDPIGGGVDLLIGIEQVDGWRWPRLRSASGHLGDLRGQLPQLEGMDVLSMARGEPCEPSPAAVAAVLASAGHTHPLVVVDLGRELGPTGRETVRQTDLALLVCGTDVRSLAAARQTADLVRPLARDLRLVVRTGRGPSGVSAVMAADTVAVPLIGSIPDDPRLRLAADHGDPPGRASRPRWNRSLRGLLDRLTPATP